jgi:hypothetical protein
MVDIPTLLTSISQGIGVLKKVQEIKSDFDQAELRAKMAEVMVTLADTKVALIEAGDEIREKDKEIARLMEAFALKEELVQRRGYWFTKNSKGEPRGRPICSRCLELEGRLLLTSKQDGERGTVICPQCKTVYKAAPAYSFEEPAPSSEGT